MAEEGPTATLPALYIPHALGTDEPAVGEAVIAAGDDVKLPLLSGQGGEALAEEVFRAPPEGDEAENLDPLSPDKLPPIPHPPVRPKREKMRYITFTAEATRHTKELKRTKRRRFSLEQKTEEEENAKKPKGPMGPDECLRCALRMEHAQCEPHKYIRVGGGFRHSYWYCKLIIQKMQEETEEAVRMLLYDAESVGKEAPNIRVRADGTVERKIKTYVRTKSGRRIVKYHYVDDKTFQKLQQLRKKGAALGHGADFEGWEPWGEPTPEGSVKEFGEDDIGSDKEIVIKDGKIFIRKKRRDSALGSDDEDEVEVEVIEQIVGYTDDGKPIIKKIYRTIPKAKKGGDDDRPDSGLTYSTKGRVVRRRTKSGRIVEEYIPGSGRGRRDKYYYDEKGRRIRRRSGSGGGSSEGSGGRRGRGRRGRGRHDSAESGGSYYDKDGKRRIRHGSGRSEYSAGGTKVRSARRSRSRRRHGSGYSSRSRSGSRGGRRRRGRGRGRHGSGGSRSYSGSRHGSGGRRRRRGRKHHDADGKSYYSSGSRSRSGSRGGRRRGRHGRRRGGRHGSGGSYSRSGSEGSLDSQGRPKHRSKGRRRHRRHGSGGSSRSGSRRRRHRRHGSGGSRSGSVVSSYSYDSQGNVTRKKHRRRRRGSGSRSGSRRGRHRRRGGGRRRRDSKGSYSSYSSYSDGGSGKGRRRRGRRRRSGSRDSRGHRRRRHVRHDSKGNSYSEYSDYSSRSRSGSRGGGRRRRGGKGGRSRRSRSRGGGRRRRRHGSGSSYSSSYYSSSSYESTEYDSEGRAKPKRRKEKDRRGRGRGRDRHGRDRHGRRRRSVSSDSSSVSSDTSTTVSSVLDLEDEDDPNITEEERQRRRERNREKIAAHEKKREEKKVAREKRREEKRIRREEQKERRADRQERRRRRGSYSSSDESTWGDGKTAVKYGKGSRRDRKGKMDGRDIGYDDPNDPWNKGKKGKGKKKDKKPRADGTYSTDSSSSEETVYDEHGNKMPKKKKDKKKKKGWFDSSSSETETEESIYEERIREDGTIEKVKVGTKKVKKKKDKKWKFRQKSADTEYDSVGSAEADKLVFREVVDEFGNVIRLTKSGRRIKDGKISKERYDWEGKAKRRRERIEAGLEPKPPSPEYEEEEIVEEYIDEEGNVVRTVRKVLKRKPGTGPPGREEEPLTGLRRVNQIFRKGGEKMLQRLKNLIAACELDDDLLLTDIDERDSSIDFLSHYHLIDRNKLEGYAKAFIVEDLDEDNILNLQETRIALEGIQSITNVSRKQTDYVLRVLGIDDSTHVTFRMFAVIAALCERMCTLDYKEKYWMELTNLMDIERKMALYKAMFYCNVNSDRSANYIKADSLRIELIAGGLNRYQEEYIMSRIQINEYREVSFLDYMAYIPLFLSMHEKICDNPLDNSRDKYAMRIGSPVMRDQMPLGLPLRLAAASMKPFKVPQEILDEVEALSTLDTLKTAPNMVRLRALKMKQRGLTKSTSTTSLEKWDAQNTHNMANNIASLIGGVSQ